jgi:putative hemolysin
MEIILEIVIILVLIMINGFLAMAEIAVVSAREIRLRLGAEEGKPGYQLALNLSQEPSRFLSSVQIGITLVGILAGAFGGTTLAVILAQIFEGLGLAQGVSEVLGITIIVVGITYLSLVFGELAPKQIALIQPERIAVLVARPMTFISRITAPLTHLLSISSSLTLRILGVRPSTEPVVTEEEVKLLVDQGTELGIFEPIEDTIVDKAFHLGDQRIDTLTTRRKEIVWLDPGDPLHVIIEKIKSAYYSHFPVARGGLDDLLGFVRTNDLLKQSLEGYAIDLRSILLDPLYIPGNTLVYNAMERMRETSCEIAFVMDEYGGIQGLITLHDLLEALVGDIPTRTAYREPDVVRRDDGTYLVSGLITIQQFREQFNLGPLPGEEERYYQTLAGFVLHLFERIPKVGEVVEWGGYRLEIVDMDDRRIDKVLLTPLSTNQSTNALL